MQVSVYVFFAFLLLSACNLQEAFTEAPLTAQEQRLVAVEQGWQLDGHFVSGSKQPNTPPLQWRFEEARSLGRRSLVVDDNNLQKSTWELRNDVFTIYYPINVNFGGKNSVDFEVERLENQDFILRALEEASLYGKVNLARGDLIRWRPAPQP